MTEDQNQQINPKLEDSINFFANHFKLDLPAFGRLPDAEKWAELFWLLTIVFFYKFANDDNIRQTIESFGDLSTDEKDIRLIEINNYIDREMDRKALFDDVYGDRLAMYRIEKIFETLPDIHSKITFLYILETDKYPEEDLNAFDKFANDLIFRADPELQVQDRLQSAFNTRNRLHLGSLEERRNRAISVDEINNYIQQNKNL